MSSLPVDKYQQQIINSITDNAVTIITAPTGSGKSTRVPQFILDTVSQPNIVVTQPRRVAAISLAHRVECERHGRGEVPNLVSYHIGRDNRTTSDTRLTYMTTGVLLRKLIRLGTLRGYTHIILDEVHERDKESDFVLMLVKMFLSPHVRVVIMSATVNADTFSRYFSPAAPIISITQSLHNVEVLYYNQIQTLIYSGTDINRQEMTMKNPDISFNMYQTAVDLIRHFDLRESDQNKGSVLIFLPGIFEIDTLKKLLSRESDSYAILILHSSIARSGQMSVFQPPKQGYRKIILSTNIAESSITVPDVKYVIDFCLSKEMHINTSTGLSSLEYRWAPLSSLDQRKGRAGRVSNGHCYRLINQGLLRMLDEWPTPEILRSSLEHLILWCKVLLANDSSGVFTERRVEEILSMVLDPPNKHQVYKSTLLLLEVGALISANDPGNSDLTFLGHAMSILPLDVRLSRLVLYGLVFGCLPDCIVMAACLSVPSFLDVPHNDKQGKLASYTAHMQASKGSHSDPIMMLNLYRDWCSRADKVTWCADNFVLPYRIEEVASIVKEISTCLHRCGISASLTTYRPDPPGYDFDLLERTPAGKIMSVKLALAAANYPHFYVTDEVDCKDGIRLFGDKNPCNTVVFTGMKVNVKSNAELQRKYLSDISKFYRGFEPILSLSLEHSRLYVTFETEQNTEGSASVSVLYALKMSKLGYKLTLSDKYSQPTFSNIVQIQAGKIEVIVTHILSVKRFYLQLIEPSIRKEWEQSMNQLQSIDRLDRLKAKDFTGMYAATVYDEDDYLYRVRIESVTLDCAKVYFLDYGNHSWVPVQGLLTLPPHLLAPPFQALECSLENIEEIGDAESNLDYLNNILLNREFEVRILYLLESTLYIDLIKEGVSLNEVLKNQGRIVEKEEDFDTQMARMTIGVGSECVKLDCVVPATEDRESVSPVGPVSPYVASFSALIGLIQTPVVDRDSVNSILVCGEHRQLLSATSVSLGGSKQNLTLRGTTYHEPVPCLSEILVMLFAPQVKLIRDPEALRLEEGPNYTGFIAGLGSVTSQPLLPEHDISMNFSRVFSDRDLEEILEVRTLIGDLLSGRNNPAWAFSCHNGVMQGLDTYIDGIYPFQWDIKTRMDSVLYRHRQRVRAKPWAYHEGWSASNAVALSELCIAGF